MSLMAAYMQTGKRRCVCLILILFLLPGVVGAAVSDVVPSNPVTAAEAGVCPDPQIQQPFHINFLGRASYAAMLAPYYALLVGLVWHYRVILRFMNWLFFILASGLLMFVLGLALEWMADLFYVWSFPVGRDFFYLEIPIFGWITGHRVPFCELLWILGVVPLFYYLWFWATLVFNDVIYVVDENGNYYKKEERWAGFHTTTRILTRPKGMKGREYERVLHVRSPGFVSKTIRKFKHVPKT